MCAEIISVGQFQCFYVTAGSRKFAFAYRCFQKSAFIPGKLLMVNFFVFMIDKVHCEWHRPFEVKIEKPKRTRVERDLPGFVYSAIV